MVYKSLLCSRDLGGNFKLNYIHFEITGDPWNLIGPKWCNLGIFALNRILSLAHQNGHEVIQIEY